MPRHNASIFCGWSTCLAKERSAYCGWLDFKACLFLDEREAWDGSRNSREDSSSLGLEADFDMQNKSPQWQVKIRASFTMRCAGKEASDR